MSDDSTNAPAPPNAGPAPRPFNAALRPDRFDGETALSYIRRMRSRLNMPETYLRSVARSRALTPTAFVEAKGAVPANTLVLDIGLVDALSGRRVLCARCTDGELVEVAPHIAYYCCLTHRTWAGPSPHAELLTPQTVRPEVINAELKFRELTAAGRVSAGMLSQAAWVACIPGTPARRAARITPSSYPDVIQLLELLTDATFLQTWTDLADSRLYRHAFVRHAVEGRLDARAAHVANRIVVLLLQGESFTRAYVARGWPTPTSPLAVYDELIAVVPGMPAQLRGAITEPERTTGTVIAATPQTPRSTATHTPVRRRSTAHRWTRDGLTREPVRSEEFRSLTRFPGQFGLGDHAAAVAAL